MSEQHQTHDATDPDKPAQLRLVAPVFANCYRVQTNTDGTTVTIVLGHDRGGHVVWHTEVISPIGDTSSLGGMLLSRASAGKRKGRR